MKWNDAHTCFAYAPFTLGGLSVWDEEWRPMEPHQFVYSGAPGSVMAIGPKADPVIFSYAEVSNGVFRFWTPASQLASKSLAAASTSA